MLAISSSFDRAFSIVPKIMIGFFCVFFTIVVFVVVFSLVVAHKKHKAHRDVSEVKNYEQKIIEEGRDYQNLMCVNTVDLNMRIRSINALIVELRRKGKIRNII